jgi:hypothetical protein
MNKKFNEIRIFQRNPYIENSNQNGHIEFVYKNNNSVMNFFRKAFDPSSFNSADKDDILIKRPYTLSEFLYYLGQTDFSDDNFKIRHFDECCLLAQDFNNPHAKKAYKESDQHSPIDDLIIMASKFFIDTRLSKNKQKEQEKLFRSFIREKLKEINVEEHLI